MNIGIGITTRNRHELFDKCLSNILKNLKYGETKIVAVDDASDVPVTDDRCEVIRHDVRHGVAKSKNDCLRKLSSCDHIFLFDDDCWPKRKGWEDAYIGAARSGKCGALCYTWDTMAHGGKLSFHEVRERTRRLKFHENPCGVMIYISKRCLETVGGFCEDYGLYGGEHADYFVRARNMNIVTKNYPDIVSSDRFFKALDREIGHVSVSSGDREELENSKAPGSHLSRVESLFLSRANSTEKWEL